MAKYRMTKTDVSAFEALENTETCHAVIIVHRKDSWWVRTWPRGTEQGGSSDGEGKTFAAAARRALEAVR